jgi:hypothetical protein
MVGEACAYVQGESLKAHAAALLTEASPDRPLGRLIHQDDTPVMLNQISDNAGCL